MTLTKPVVSPASVDHSSETVGGPPNESTPMEAELGMSTEQIEILSTAFADVPEALEVVSQDLADRIRGDQEAVADTRRRAQVNSDLLRLRVR